MDRYIVIIHHLPYETEEHGTLLPPAGLNVHNLLCSVKAAVSEDTTLWTSTKALITPFQYLNKYSHPNGPLCRDFISS